MLQVNQTKIYIYLYFALPSGMCKGTSQRRRTTTWRPPCAWVVKEYYLALSYLILIHVYGVYHHGRAVPDIYFSQHIVSVSLVKALFWYDRHVCCHSLAVNVLFFDIVISSLYFTYLYHIIISTMQTAVKLVKCTKLEMGGDVQSQQQG